MPKHKRLHKNTSEGNAKPRCYKLQSSCSGNSWVHTKGLIFEHQYDHVLRRGNGMRHCETQHKPHRRHHSRETTLEINFGYHTAPTVSAFLPVSRNHACEPKSGYRITVCDNCTTQKSSQKLNSHKIAAGPIEKLRSRPKKLKELPNLGKTKNNFT